MQKRVAIRGGGEGVVGELSTKEKEDLTIMFYAD